MRIVACCAPLWRITFVAPSRTVQASTASTCRRQRDLRVDGLRLDARRLERHPRARQLARQRRAAIAGDRLADLARAPRATTSCRSAICCDASSGWSGSSRPASWAFSAISDRLWPSRSCRSRAKRSRSSATQSARSSSPVAFSSRVRTAPRSGHEHADRDDGEHGRHERVPAHAKHGAVTGDPERRGHHDRQRRPHREQHPDGRDEVHEQREEFGAPPISSAIAIAEQRAQHEQNRAVAVPQTRNGAGGRIER